MSALRPVVARKQKDDEQLSFAERQALEIILIAAQGLIDKMNGKEPDFTPLHIRRQRENIARWEKAK